MFPFMFIGFPMASKPLTQKALFPAAQFVFMEGNKDLCESGVRQRQCSPSNVQIPLLSERAYFKAKLTKTQLIMNKELRAGERS